ncbi:MAG: hypothetical protein ACYTGW_01935 [Planctomycetota bacterium]
MLANPFKMNDSVFPKTVKLAAKEGVTERKNLTFHRQTTHPLVDRRNPVMTPGWNASNGEIAANKRSACYALFDQDGKLVFQGRLTFAEVEAKVAKLLRKKRSRR